MGGAGGVDRPDAGEAGRVYAGVSIDLGADRRRVGRLIEGRSEAGDALAGNAAGAVEFAEAFNFVELLLRDEPARDALLGFENQTLAIFIGRVMREPRGVVPLVAGPLDVAAVDVDVNLKFSLDGIAVPPAKSNAHAGMFEEPGTSARANSATTRPG